VIEVAARLGINKHSLYEWVKQAKSRAEGVRPVASGSAKSGAQRGQFVKPENVEHHLAKHCNGNPIVVLARDLDYFWSRFVYVKEVMHVFDEALARVGTADEFESLILAMTGPEPGERPASVDSEVMAYWMALGCFCPEELRQDLQRQYQAGELSERQISERLKIPEHAVSRLFRPHFKELMSELRRAG
jgi:transposase